MNEALERARAAWEMNKDYKADAIPEVWKAYQEYRAENPDIFPYNAAIEAYITKKYGVRVDLADFLGTQVYLAQHQNRREQQKMQDIRMAKEGFIRIDRSVEYRGPVEVKAKREMDIMSYQVAETGKFVDGTHGAFFIPKGRRTRGYSIFSLEGYYRPITQ